MESWTECLPTYVQERGSIKAGGKQSYALDDHSSLGRVGEDCQVVGSVYGNRACARGSIPYGRCHFDSLHVVLNYGLLMHGLLSEPWFIHMVTQEWAAL